MKTLIVILSLMASATFAADEVRANDPTCSLNSFVTGHVTSTPVLTPGDFSFDVFLENGSQYSGVVHYGIIDFNGKILFRAKLNEFKNGIHHFEIPRQAFQEHEFWNSKTPVGLLLWGPGCEGQIQKIVDLGSFLFKR